VRVWQGPSDLFVRSVFDVIRVSGGVVDHIVGAYEHQFLPNDDPDTPWLIGRRRVLIDHNIETGGGSLGNLLGLGLVADQAEALVVVAGSDEYAADADSRRTAGGSRPRTPNWSASTGLGGPT
jgi:hypothetical protein